MRIHTALTSFSLFFLGAAAFACSDVSDGDLDDSAEGAGGDGSVGAGGGSSPGAGGEANPGAGGNGNPGVGGDGNPGVGGNGNPGAGGNGNPGAGGDGNPGAGGDGNPGVGGDGNPGAGGGEGDGAGGAPVVDKPGYAVSGDGVPWTEGELAEGSGNASISVDANDEKQDWHGFGGTYNEKGWDALMALDEADRDRAIRLLFSPTEGAGFTFGRIPIGSSDYGLNRYSLNETANDFEMANFSIARDR